MRIRGLGLTLQMDGDEAKVLQKLGKKREIRYVNEEFDERDKEKEFQF